MQKAEAKRMLKQKKKLAAFSGDSMASYATADTWYERGIIVYDQISGDAIRKQQTSILQYLKAISK